MKKLLLASFFLITAVAFAQDYKERIVNAVNLKLDSLWKGSRAPGLNVSIVFPDGQTHTFSRGFAHEEKEIPMTAETKMLGGSTGKVFYSAVAMQLIEEGKLHLDSPIYAMMSSYQWFDRIPNAKDLTVRALMRHESGIPRYVFKERFQKDILKNPDRVWKPEELLSYIFDESPLFHVGESFTYSDTNYIILGMLIEKVTGNTLYQEVQKRVLDKIGLKNVEPQTKRVYENIAQGYNGYDEFFFPGFQFDKYGKSYFNLQFEWAGGGLVITSHDLALLGKNIYEGKLFDKELLAEYLNGREAKKLGGKWGLGVHIRNSPWGTLYGHSGFMPGYLTNMMYSPEHKFVLSYQLNTSDEPRATIFRKLPQLCKVIIQELEK